MKSSGIREKLHKYVDNADSDALQSISEAIIAYQAKTQKGNKEETNQRPAIKHHTEEELLSRIEQSEENLKNGKYLTEKEMDGFISKLNARV